jgi:hypothetical protein
MLARSIVVAFLFVAAELSCWGETPPQLNSGRHAPSPDRKLYVFYEAPKFEIRDAKRSAVLGSVDQEQPVEALRWTGDSKTLVVVQYVAHGSDAYFLHWDGVAWRPQFVRELFEKEDYRAIAVVHVKPHTESVDITCKTYIPTRLVSFTFTPSTRKVSNLRRHDITVRQWDQLHMFPLGEHHRI